MSNRLELCDVDVGYGARAVVRAASFALGEGEIGCLLGSSGCGKTTLLRAIAGFEPVSSGEIWIHGRRVATPGQMLAPEERRVGMVFQDFALFPHLSVARNIGFGLRHLSRRERRARVASLLELVGLGHTAELFPHQLSGGMQQRVALARAMAPRPEVLLLDEPFSSMDAALREQLAREVREVLKREGVTAVLVTHDQLEAFAMADRIAMLADGTIQQCGSGFSLYHEPVNRLVADFIGQGAFLPATAIDALSVRTELGRIAGTRPHGLALDLPAEVLIRPDDLVDDDASPVRATVVERAYRGAEYLYRLELPSGAEVLCLLPSHHQYAPGAQIGIRLEAKHLVAFARTGVQAASPGSN
ncbi:ABC transporter ATP-binding protein [Thiorhodococcus mannitoliphagus]|uniref:ABC transporter ATP-binding protein n=1 Tax=Thiorhodococcus mannitoliphagus TaxID=329406 RepID=A0A6P1DR61_9GAMM|nr:ABC transporter ATP-binding protein [Thiorhodococcus mannitoliphagus]NEX20379.1 ABC transporter ATP-binding protein [Thiorhodococcus mannitoliphagus]